MTKEEMIQGLQAGRTLVLDGWAHEDERKAIAELVEADLVTMEFREGNQCSAYYIKWKQQEGTDGLSS